MRLLPMKLFKNLKTGEDALGNPIHSLEQVGSTDGRFSSWSSEEIALDTREMTANHRKIVTAAAKADLESVEYVELQGSRHELTDIRGDDLQRWRLLVVKRYGSAADANPV